MYRQHTADLTTPNAEQEKIELIAEIIFSVSVGVLAAAGLFFALSA